MEMDVEHLAKCLFEYGGGDAKSMLDKKIDILHNGKIYEVQTETQVTCRANDITPEEVE
jgi:hypothetical protein